MNYQQFIEQLPNLYDNWTSDSVVPKSQQFEPILDRVQGVTTVNVMQLLNWAVACMEPEEVYCEVGCFQGASLIGALLEHPEQMAYGVDNFSEFDTLGDSFDNLIANLSNFNLENQVIFCPQDVEEFFFELTASQIEDKIGLYFYDGAQDYRSRLMGLLLVKPFLANQALIVLGHCNWEATYQASLDFMAAHPQSNLLLEFAANHSTGWNGLHVISWDVNAHHKPDWSRFQESKKQALISAIKELHEKARQQVVEAWYKEASELYLSGKYEKAEHKYKQILNSDINQAEAWCNLGRLYYYTERYQDSLESLLRALELDSSNASWHYELGLVLEKLGAIAQAIRAYQAAIAIEPQSISAYNSLGNIWFKAGELEQAESMYRQVLVACPDHCAGYINLGNVLIARHQVDAAIEAYEKALSLKPNAPDILNNLALAFEAKNDKAQALKYFGYSCYHQKNYQEAINYYQKFQELQTGDVDFYLALASCYRSLNQYAVAIEVYREGISLYPKVDSLYYNLALDLQELDKTEEFFAVLNEGLQWLPDNLSLKLHQQLTLPIVYDSPEEIESYRQRFTQGLEALVQQTKLDTPEVISNALIALSRWTNFYLQYQGKNDLNLQKKYGQFVHQVMAANYPDWVKPLSILPNKEGEKIRVGYISAFLRNHNGGKWALGWLKNHNKHNFEIYCYYTGREVDTKTLKFQFFSDSFHHITDRIQAVCQQIVTDKLHILVFTDIGMDASVSRIAGLRLAPVQCNAWGHPVTSGLPTIDYYLSSELMEPENAQEHYTEKLINLPNIGICYEKSEMTEVTKNRSNFLLQNDAIVYLSCQS